MTTPLFIGGEMPHWSDRDPVGGPVLRELVSSAHGHTLIVGPHDPALIEAVPARHVTVLVRGVPDAEALAARFAARPGLEVCCGSLEKLAAVPSYDLVIALDGLDRTGSTETGDISWAAGFALLMAVLRPGGRLILGMDNQIGLHRLFACATDPGGTNPGGADLSGADLAGAALGGTDLSSADSDDAGWAAPPADDPTRPTAPARLRDRVREGGLTVLRAYAAHPSPRSPSVLLSEAVLDAPELDGYVSGVLRRAGTPGRPMLVDPRPVAVRMVRHGLGADLAPGWVVVAAHGGGSGPALPEALIADGTELHRVSRSAGAGRERAMWIRTTASWAGAGIAGPGELVPVGGCLHDLLLMAIRARDTPRLRDLLSAWQGGELAGLNADAVIVGPEGRLHPAGAPPGSGRDAGGALRRFARVIHDEGLAHLWPSPADEAGTAALLAACAGVEVDVAAVSADEVRAARLGTRALRDVIAAQGRLARELSEARAQADWYEQRLAARDAELARAYRIISLFKGTVPGKAATAVRGVLRSGKRVARSALGRIQPDR